MIRFLLSLIILTLLIIYALLPAIRYLRQFARKEKERIKKSFIENKIEKDDSE